MSSPKPFETLLISTEDNITTICMNRPQKKNAISSLMYEEIAKALELAAKDESILTVLTGSGDYYSSGNDLSSSANVDFSKLSKASNERFSQFVKTFIDFPKPLVAVVNGPAIGIAVTLLGLFDAVYASDRATFQTPFSQLGLSPEGCSTYTFPKIMGAAKANEMLVFNKKLSAAQACQQGLVSEVFPDRSFQTEVWARLRAYAKLPKNSLHLSKQLIRSTEREHLHAVNELECERLRERQLSDECSSAIRNFYKTKSHL